MARVNFCGFETGDSSEASSTSGTFSIQTTTVRSGQYALRCNPATTAVGYVHIQGLAADGTSAVFAENTVYVRFYFLFLTMPASSSEEILAVMDSSAASRAQIRIDSSGHLSAWDGTTQMGSTGTTVLSSGVWYCVEMKVAGAAPFDWEIRINGVTEISGNNGTNANTNAAGRFGKVTNRNGNTVDFYYDDIAMDSAAYPGPGSVIRFDPTADVAKTNYTDQGGGTTNIFNSVDDLASQAGHDTDTTYIVTSTSGVQTYTASFATMESKGILLGMQINEVKMIAFGRDTGTTLTWRISIRPASNAVTTTALDGGNTYAMRAALYKTSGGTDALTVANMNTCQASFVHVQANARELRCTALAIMVDVAGAVGRQKILLQAVERAAVM